MKKFHVKQKIYKSSKTSKTKITVYHNNRCIATIKFFDLIYPAFYIFYLNVDEKYMNKGIGTYLMRESFRQGQNRGCIAVSLYVKINNTHAIKFYEKLGFFISSVNNDKRICGPHYLMSKKF